MAGVDEEVKQYVQDRIKENEQKLLDLIGTAASYVDKMDKMQQAMIEKMQDQDQRMVAIINDANGIKDSVQATQNVNDEKLNELNARGLEQDDKFGKLVENIHLVSNEHRSGLTELKEKIETDTAAVKAGLDEWSIKFQKEMEEKQSAEGSGGEERGGHGSRPPRVDKKEVAVWKLANGVLKPDFRHWITAVEINLEAVHGFEKPDLVLDKIRRCQTEITADSLDTIIEEINDDVEVKGTIDPATWKFEEKSRFLYLYLVNKLSTELHEKTLGIDDNNGLELYRLIYNSVDAIPENT